MKSQKEQVLEYMRENGSITTLEAINAIGCTRLSGRIHELKADGIAIKTEMVHVPTRSGKTWVSRYSVVEA